MITPGSQFVKDRSAFIKENVDMEQFADKSINSMIFAAEDVNIHNCLSLVGTMILSPRLSVFMNYCSSR